MNLKATKRHGAKHKGSIENVAVTEKEMPQSQPPPTLQTDEVSIGSNNELTLFPPISYDDNQTELPLFRATSSEEVSIVSVHYNLPELSTMETTV